MTSMDFYLFGDGLEEYTPRLQRLFQTDVYPTRIFLDAVYTSLRLEFGQLSRTKRERLLQLTDLEDLLAQYWDGTLDSALYPALTSICQTASFINYQIENERCYPRPDNAFLVGIGIGSLTASTISCCKNVIELSRVAVGLVRLAFRLGLHVQNMQSSIERSESPSSWALSIPAVAMKDAQQLISDFHNKNRINPLSQLCISAFDHEGVRISGPPSVLDSFQQTIRHGHETRQDPYQGAYHLSHLYTEYDKNFLLQQACTLLQNQRRTLPLLLGSTGRLAGSNDLYELVGIAFDEVLLKPINWQDLAHGIAYATHFSPTMRTSLQTLGLMNVDKLSAAVAKKGCSIPDVLEQQEQVALKSTPNSYKPKIAVTGMSGRFPEAENLAEFWDLLVHGRDVHSQIPQTRWNVNTHFDPTGKRKNTSATPYGCWLKNPGLFDIKFFNMSPREAPQVDPASRLALMTAYEAMEQAGMVPGATPSSMHDRVGVFYGVSSNDWMEQNSSQTIDTYFIAGGCRAFIPGRINYFFKFSGGSFSFDTACSSSLSATHAACNALWEGDIDTAIVGGTNVLTNPDYTAGLDRGHFLSRTGNCKTFDDSADGYCRGEAVATLILKRLDDAIADKDPIIGLVNGALTNHSAEAESITRPHIGAQKAIFKKILHNSHVDSREVSYVEMHGTGTQAGDPVEMNSVLDTLALSNPKHLRHSDQLLYLGSAKANIGHGEGAAGATSLTKILLMMQENKIPPHCGIKTKINEKYPKNLHERGVRIAKEARAWVRPEGRTRKAFVNNFSAAGGNSAILLEDAPLEIVSCEVDPRTSQIVAISAKTHSSLEKGVKSWLTFLDSCTSDKRFSLPALSYTCTARRMHHHLRVAVQGSNLEEIKSALQQILPDCQEVGRIAPHPKVMFAFTGNGTQYCGMGRQLYEHVPSFRENLHRLNNIVQQQGFPSIMPVFENTPTPEQNPGRTSNKTSGAIPVLPNRQQGPLKNNHLKNSAHVSVTMGTPPDASGANTCSQMPGDSRGVLPKTDCASNDIEDYAPCIGQLATFCLEIALARLLISFGILPSLVVGHSLGEYAALVISGVLSESDAVYLIGMRTQLLEQRCTAGTHAMLAVRASREAINHYLDDCPEISCVNSADDVVLGGTKEAIQQAQQILRQGNIKTAFLKVSYAFHTSQIDAILDDFEMIAQNVQPQQPAIPILSPLTTEIVSTKSVFTPKYFRNHARHAVKMADVLRKAYSTGLITEKSTTVEIGPHPIFSSMLRGLSDSIAVLPVLKRHQDTWQDLTKTLVSLYKAGVDIDWAEYHRPFPGAHRVLRLPAYQWDLKNYWIQYVNDWGLRKGEPAVVSDPQPKPEQTPSVQTPSATSTVELKPTSSIHTVLSETVTKFDHEIRVESDLMHPSLKQVVSGHIVNGVPLCTPSLYAEIAMTLGLYAQEKHGIDRELMPKIVDLEIQRALIVSKDSPSRSLRTSAQLDIESKIMQCKFSTINHAGHNVAEHSCCTIQFVPKTEALLAWHAAATSGKSRIQDLDKAANTGAAFRFNKHMIYRMVSGVATFDETYRGVDEMVLDSAAMDASSRLTLQNLMAADGFTCHPVWLDLLAQSPGFIMNGNEQSNLSEQVFVNHGWRGLSLFQKIVPGRKYETFSWMKESQGKRWEGDVLVFHEEEVVACFEGVVLQGLSRKALEFVLRDAVRSKPDDKTLQVSQSKATNSGNELDHSLATSRERKVVDEHKPYHEVSQKTINVTVKSKTIEEHGQTQEIVKHKQVVVNRHCEEQPVPSALDTKVMEMISEESGVLGAELTGDARFADLGIDSLLSLMIVSRLREEFPDLTIESTIFVDHPSVSSLKTYFRAMDTPETNGDLERYRASYSEDELSTSDEELNEVASKASTISSISSEPRSLSVKRQLRPVPPASSVILHGRPRSSPRTLILFPDGSGSASSYAKIVDPINRTLCIIGLNSPYHRNADDFACSLDDLLASYITELRRRQPFGPYHLGGWSSGGILAYRAAQLLILEGDDVKSLTLLDSPMPKHGLDRLPEKWFDLYRDSSIFKKESHVAQSNPSQERHPDTTLAWLIPHFQATIELLHAYRPTPLPTGFTPKVTVVWAARPVEQQYGSGSMRFELGPGEQKTGGLCFLTEQKQDFSAGDWATLFPGEEVGVEVVEGADHFSMMSSGYAGQMADLLERATLA